MSNFKFVCLISGLSLTGIIVLGALMYGYYWLNKWLSGFTPNWVRTVISILIATVVMTVGAWSEVKQSR